MWDPVLEPLPLCGCPSIPIAANDIDSLGSLSEIINLKNSKQSSFHAV